MPPGLKAKVMGAIGRAVSSQEKVDAFFSNPVLGTSELQRGDILLVKLFEGYDHWAAVDRANPGGLAIGEEGYSIVVAQSVFCFAKHGSATAEHAMIIANNGAETAYESVGSGVLESPSIYDRWHAVYRVVPALNNVANEATDVAMELARRKTAGNLAAPGQNPQGSKPSVDYRSAPGMYATVFRSKRRGPMSDIRIKRIYEAVYMDDARARLGLKMICTEFVASCYEVAAKALGVPPVLNVDPRAMSAKAFEDVLYRRASYIPMVGIYKGSKRIVKTCPNCGGPLKFKYFEDAQGRPIRATVHGDKKYPFVSMCPNCAKCTTCNNVLAATFDPPGSLSPAFYCRACNSPKDRHDELTGVQFPAVNPLAGMNDKIITGNENFI